MYAPASVEPILVTPSKRRQAYGSATVMFVASRGERVGRSGYLLATELDSFSALHVQVSEVPDCV